MVATTSIHSLESVWGQCNLCTLTSASWHELMWDECLGNDGKHIYKCDIFIEFFFFFCEKCGCQANNMITETFFLCTAVIKAILNTSKSKGIRLLSLKPYANLLNNWEESCCDQDDFSEGDPGTSNYNRCETVLYLPPKLHWSSVRKQHKEMLVSLLGDLFWFSWG